MVNSSFLPRKCSGMESNVISFGLGVGGLVGEVGWGVGGIAKWRVDGSWSSTNMEGSFVMVEVYVFGWSSLLSFFKNFLLNAGLVDSYR